MKKNVFLLWLLVSCIKNVACHYTTVQIYVYTVITCVPFELKKLLDDRIIEKNIK